MSRNKVALYLPSLAGGGAERVFAQLANQFAMRGISVDLVLASKSGPYLGEVAPNVNIVGLGASGVFGSLPNLVRYLRQSRPDVMLSGLDHANIIAILARSFSRSGIRGVVSMRSVPTAVYSQDHSIRRWVMLQLIRFLYPVSDVIVANSAAVKNDLSASLNISNRMIRVIYNPLDIEHIDRESRVENDHDWLQPGAPPVVVAVGSLTVLKDFPTLIRAFSIVRKVRDCCLVILGEGPERGKLEELIGNLGMCGDVLMPGFVRNPFPWLKRAKVFVSSSLTEGCPNALMQALACDTNVISTDCVGGSAEILENGKWGMLVSVGDAEGMAQAILTTLSSARKPNAKPRANDFALDSIVDQYLRVLFPYDSPQYADGKH